jgi:diadenylate cyclase
MNQILASFQNIQVRDVIDILLVAAVFYGIFRFLRETRAQQLFRGIVLIFIFNGLTGALRLYTITGILNGAITMGFIALLIVFQPELRRGLELLGRGNIFKQSLSELRGESVNHIVDEMMHAISSLARQQIGALIVIERRTGLQEVIETGTRMDALITSELLINIFIPGTPLHDGAVVIKDDRIRAAASFLPLTDDTKLDRDLGTRHRAAIGMSEESDAFVIVVSEETGDISYAEHGKLSRYVDEDLLREKLTSIYQKDDSGFFLQNLMEGVNHEEKE